jgi:hypothetical protein
MVASEPFALLAVRLQGELERHRLTCETCDAPAEVRYAQGAAAALRVALRLPQQILADIEAGRKRK